MSRPDFPRPYCVLPANCIRRIREEQRYYDEDPERFERQERAREEARLLEQEQERQYWEECERQRLNKED